MQIDPVQERSGEPAEVVLALPGRAPADLDGGTAPAARVGGGHELKTGREARGSAGAGDGDRAVLERLPEGLQRSDRELGQLVEEQDAQVGQADLARMGDAPAADQPGVGHGVMGGAEGAGPQQPALRRECPGHAPDGRSLQGLVER